MAGSKPRCPCGRRGGPGSLSEAARWASRLGGEQAGSPALGLDQAGSASQRRTVPPEPCPPARQMPTGFPVGPEGRGQDTGGTRSLSRETQALPPAPGSPGTPHPWQALSCPLWSGEGSEGHQMQTRRLGSRVGHTGQERSPTGEGRAPTPQGNPTPCWPLGLHRRSPGRAQPAGDKEGESDTRLSLRDRAGVPDTRRHREWFTPEVRPQQGGHEQQGGLPGGGGAQAGL